MWIAPDATQAGRSKEERRPATDPPRRAIARVPSIDAGGDAGEDPRALVSLLERVLQKISSIPGALEAISSDPALLCELQQHELLFYPSSTPTRTSLSALDSNVVPLGELQSSQQELMGDDDGDDFPVAFAPPQHKPASSSNVAIPAMALLPPPPMSASLASNSPSFSMGMLSMSPGTYSQDGEPVSALWPRQPNEFAFTQEDESKEDELYNEVLCSDDDDDHDASKVFEMDMEEDDDAPFLHDATAVLRDEETLQDDDDDDDDDGDDAEIQYETMRLRIVREKNKTGFEPSQEWEAHAGVLLGGQYSIHGLIGEAVFSQTYKATDTRTGQLVCLKVIKNNKEYFDQGLDEIRVLEYMRNSVDDIDAVHVLRLLDCFYYKEHLILVTELLRDNLYEFSRLVRTQPDASALSAYFTLPRLKKIALECLEALAFLHRQHIVHCDLKPENIVMKSVQRCEIKVIDFGSASFVSDELTFYVQSRSYRAPEVILGRRYDEKVDVWSLGCILAELYTGHVLFANDSVVSLLGRMMSILGAFPTSMLRSSPDVAKYFDADFVLRSPVPPKTSLWHVLHCADHLFIDFLQSLLTVDPSLRVTAAVAIQHPWLQTNVFGRH
ncbi:CMGC/DYRK protein kinase [Saprolegnia diclina VS20]|uniref:CMGC/DYRK protein kinase n=1 Tax=Saprolegnia diclina (strain VS20) TaxID=1156394 RepID=T0RIW3_SAPDV|nr:CMGC/DYRK protein kinase [Saprolegnia diclina VS20]EQC32318.1 CMGC/DYRK protein kinase [Saprolegnia diclina VS20]|eukprot:XP_008614259.1 CMGC/DYRK protein kinase [Saprolegnia diclina VS20]